MINYYWKDKVLRIPMNYSTIFSKRAVLGYNAFTKQSQIGISMDKFRELAGVPTYENIPLSQLKLKIKDPKNSQLIGNELQKKMASKNNDKLWEYS